MHVQTLSTRPLLGGEGPGDEAMNLLDSTVTSSPSPLLSCGVGIQCTIFSLLLELWLQN